MEGFNEIIEENKTKIIVIAIVLILAIIMSVVNIFLPDTAEKEITATKGTKDVIEEIATTYYEKVIFPNMTNSEFEKYASEGYFINLRDLTTKVKGIDKEVFLKEENFCDFTTTYVIIYPRSLDKKEYTVKSNISCVDKTKENV